MANVPTQATLCGLEKPNEAFCESATQCELIYLWQVEGRLRMRDAELWEMIARRATEYFQAVKIRDMPKRRGRNSRDTS